VLRRREKERCVRKIRSTMSERKGAVSERKGVLCGKGKEYLIRKGRVFCGK
jgi:hypothetical protein